MKSAFTTHGNVRRPIYQRCRTREAIDADFEQLQLEFADAIDTQMAVTRTKLLEHFDAQVHDRLRVRLDASRSAVTRHQELLSDVLRFALKERAGFDASSRHLTITEPPDGLDLEVPRVYSLVRPQDDERVHQLRSTDPVAQWALATALRRPSEAVGVRFDHTGWAVRALELERLIGDAGVLRAVKLTIAGKDEEEHLLLAAVTSAGHELTEPQIARLLQVPATEHPQAVAALPAELATRLEQLQADRLESFGDRRAAWLGGEYEKLDRWANDERHRLRSDVSEIERAIKDQARAIRDAGTEPERLPLRREKLQLERQLHAARRDYDAAAETVDGRQEAMLDKIEQALQTKHTSETLFTINWELR